MRRRQPIVMPPPEALLALDHQLCFALYSTSLAMTKAYRPLLADLGLTYPQYLAMLALWEGDGVNVGALGERLFLDSGTLTPLLKRLETQGLVERRRGREDERTVTLHLTREGRALKRRAVAVPAAMLCTLDCGLDELHGLVSRLTALRARLVPTPTTETPP